MDTLYGTASIVETLTCLSPGSARLLERALTFTDILHFLDVFLFPRSPLSPLVPCFDASPNSNIYGDYVDLCKPPPPLPTTTK